jgi:hypothetical protein
MSLVDNENRLRQALRQMGRVLGEPKRTPERAAT